MEALTAQELAARIRAGESLEVVGYEGDRALVDRVKGVVKGDFAQEDLSELRRRRPRGRPTEEQLELAARAALRLAEARRTFKVVFGPKEVTIRAGGGFMRVAEDGVRVAGFSGPQDDPLPLIMDILRQYGQVKFLRPLR